jgi:hypothetical protein
MAFDPDLRTLIKTVKKVSKKPFVDLKPRPDWNEPTATETKAEQPIQPEPAIDETSGARDG